MQGNGTRRASFAEVLRNRDFLALWLGQIISQIGDSFTYLALLITVNQLTGSTVAMGTMMISLTLPPLLLSFLAGAIADRVDRKRLMIASDLLRGLLVLAFLTVRSAEQVYIFYIIGFLVSSVSLFFAPAKTAMIPKIVEGEDRLLTANALSQTVRVVSLLIGPALAGFVIGWLGPGVAFVVDSLTFLASAIAILTISTSGKTTDTERVSATMLWNRLAQGLSYTIRHRTVLGIIITLLVAFLGIGAVEVLFVPYLQGEFGARPEALGLVQTSQGVGMLVGSVLVGNLAARFRLTRIIAWSIALLGLGVAACGLVSQFVLIPIAMFVAGLALAPINAALTTLMQVTVPNDKLGRVGSVVDSTTTVSYLISMGGAAFVADALGIRTVFILAGIITALSALPALTMMKEPQTREPGRRMVGSSHPAEYPVEG